MYLPSVFRLCSGIGLAACLAGCSLWGSEPAQVPGMSLECELETIHRCSKISPEIKVRNPPKEVAYYDVRLKEIVAGQEPRSWGGGTWRHGILEEGVETIPEGTLTSHYRGPCPPAGQEGRYLFEVFAMPANGSSPLATAVLEIKVEPTE